MTLFVSKPVFNWTLEAAASGDSKVPWGPRGEGPEREVDRAVPVLGCSTEPESAVKRQRRR